MIKLVVADAMQPHARVRRHHKIERGTGRPPIGKWRGESARGDPLFTFENHRPFLSLEHRTRLRATTAWRAPNSENLCAQASILPTFNCLDGHQKSKIN